MANQEHVKWLKEGVEAWNKRREKGDFIPALEEADLAEADLEGADLRGANLCRADLVGANLSYADLEGAKLIASKLGEADLSYADLAGSNLCRSNLVRAILWTADLRGADLSYTDLAEAYLVDANLTGADLSHSKPWQAYLWQNSSLIAQENDTKEIESIECLLQKCRKLRNNYKDDILFYFRGESRIFERENRTPRELRPSVMRHSKGEFPFREWEGEMLLDLMSRQPEAFSGLTLAIDQWVLAQHHRLKTRLLDITRNPLVALFNASKKDDTQNGSNSEDGRLHVFAIPRDMVKPFNSDSISIIANFSKLRRSEQNLLLGKSDVHHSDPKDDPPAGNYAEVMGRLYNFIWHEKPSFQEKIDPRDLFRVFVVEPQRSFERIRAQSGAFLISAFHERFERDEILELNDGIPVYDHYMLTVSGESKKKEYIRDELRLLNITHESLFPGLDEAADAVIQRYSTDTSSDS